MSPPRCLLPDAYSGCLLPDKKNLFKVSCLCHTCIFCEFMICLLIRYISANKLHHPANLWHCSADYNIIRVINGLVRLINQSINYSIDHDSWLVRLTAHCKGGAGPALWPGGAPGLGPDLGARPWAPGPGKPPLAMSHGHCLSHVPIPQLIG